MRSIPWQCASIVAGIAGAVLVSLAAGCNRQPATSSEQQAQGASSHSPLLKVVQPKKKDVRRLIERPGRNIEAYERTALYAKLAGYVFKWNVDMGDPVKGPRYDSNGKLLYPGDVLAELYIPEMEVELKQKEAAVGQAAAEIMRAEAAKVRAKAELKRADSQYARLARLAGSLEGKDQVEEYRLGFEAAQAALANAEADVAFAKARLEVAKADRDHVQTLLQYTKVRAPFDGVVTGKRTVNRGDFVQPASASKEESLFVVERIKPVRVFINVQELNAAWVRAHDVALIRIQSLPGQEFKGEVTRVSKSLDPENRTLRTQIDLPNGDGKLLPGTFVTATIIVERKNVWALPASAVVTRGEQTFCYRVENGKAVRTPIQVGLRGNEPENGLVEVLKKQTKPSRSGAAGPWEDFTGVEVVVGSPPDDLKDGQVVYAARGKQP
jgi:RND family efflux transporter MFP subunit